MTTTEALPKHMTPPTKLGNEISITGKWIPRTKGGLFRKSPDSDQMIAEWEAIHQEAKNHPGMLSTEINHAIGQDAVLVHHIFQDEQALLSYFKNTANSHQADLTAVAKPDIHLLRGVQLSEATRSAIESKGVELAAAEYVMGYVKNEYQQPDPKDAVQVTAKWTCKPGENVEDLIYWWQRVGTDAWDLEEGLVRFEVYKVIGENALIIHETFDNSDELKFHLTKGTAARYKKSIDAIAAPENYFFRGPVSWTIRTYSKFMGLPATYSTQGSHFTVEGGTYSEGITKNTKSNIMNDQTVSVVYKWTAKEGKENELLDMYREVSAQMEANEPGALHVDCFFDEVQRTLVVYDLFEDANAVGFHLSTTAAAHFNNLLQIAVPGEFIFCGEMPEELKAATQQMGLKATFAPKVFGFDKQRVVG